MRTAVESDQVPAGQYRPTPVPRPLLLMADAVAYHSAARHFDMGDYYNPGDDVGDILVWLWREGHETVALDLVVNLVKHLRSVVDEDFPVAKVIGGLAHAGSLLDDDVARDMLPALQERAMALCEAEGLHDPS